MEHPEDVYTFRLQYEIGKLNLLERLFSMCESPEDVFNYSDKDTARNQMMGLAKIIEQATDTMNEFVNACEESDWSIRRANMAVIKTKQPEVTEQE